MNSLLVKGFTEIILSSSSDICIVSSARIASSSRQNDTRPTSGPILGCIWQEATAPKPLNVSNNRESLKEGGKLVTILVVAVGAGQNTGPASGGDGYNCRVTIGYAILMGLPLSVASAFSAERGT